MKQQAGAVVSAQTVAEWYAPANTATVLKYRSGVIYNNFIRHLVHKHNPTNIAMYVPRESVIYIDQVTAVCSSGIHHSPECSKQKMASPPTPKRITFLVVPEDSSEVENSLAVSVPSQTCQAQTQQKCPYWRPVFILVPLRLGIDKIIDVVVADGYCSLKKEYVEGLKILLQCPQTVGIIGGRPKQSLYFVGYQGKESLFFHVNFKMTNLFTWILILYNQHQRNLS